MVESEYNWKDIGLKGKFNTNNELEGTVTFNNISPGLKVEVTGVERFGPKKKAEASLITLSHYLKPAVSYQNEFVALKLGLKYKFEKLAVKDGHFNVTFQYPERLNIGFNVTAKTKDYKPHFNVRAQWKESDYTAVGALEQIKDDYIASFSFIQNISHNVKFATVSKCSKGNTKPSSIAVGGSWTVDPDTTVRGKFEVEGANKFNLGLALQQTVTQHATVTMGADISVSDLLKNTGSNHSFGLEFLFK